MSAKVSFTCSFVLLSSEYFAMSPSILGFTYTHNIKVESSSTIRLPGINYVELAACK